MEILTNESDREDMIRTFFIFLFFVVWVIALQGIITGQIVDAFCSLRDEKDGALSDLDEVCFVCSQGRLTFDKVGGFVNHVEAEHDRWAYLSFVKYLRYVTPPSSFSDFCLELTCCSSPPLSASFSFP